MICRLPAGTGLSRSMSSWYTDHMEMTRVFVNPLRQMRLDLGWTLDHTADQLDTTRQFVIRAEQGVYANPPPRLTQLLLGYGDVPLSTAAVGVGSDEDVVYHLYHEFQVLTRKRNYGALRPDYDFKSGFLASSSIHPLNHHPLLRWRWWSNITGRIGVSKLFCVHPALITKFERTPHLCVEPPGDLMNALRQSGYAPEILDSFVSAYHTYKEHLSIKFREDQNAD